VSGSALSQIGKTKKYSTYTSRHVKSKLFELVLQAVLGNAMESVERELRALSAKSQTGAVHVEHGVVQISLGICELATDGPSSGNIGDIASKFLYFR